jgi:hypothetical protein
MLQGPCQRILQWIGAEAAAEVLRATACAPAPCVCVQGGEAAGESTSGRVIVFTNLRDSVSTIIEALRLQQPLITARCAARCALRCSALAHTAPCTDIPSLQASSP